MTDPSRVAAAEKAIGALRSRYLAGAPAIVEAFEGLAAALSNQPTAPQVLETLRRELHRIRGTAGSFGYADVSTLAGAMEDRALRWDADSELETPERATIVARFAAGLRAAFGITSADGLALAQPASRRLVTIDLPAALAGSLSREGELRGYEVLSRQEGDWSPATLRAMAPDVIATVADSAHAVHLAIAGSHLPLLVIDESRDRDLMRRVAALSGVRILRIADDPAGVFDVAGRASDGTSWAGATILVCDDDADMRQLVQAIGEQAGMRVATLADPDRLLEELDRQRPSLLLLDINLGEADGLRLATAVRRVDAHAHLPLIMFSSQTDAKTREAVVAAGADDFLAKPIVASELRACINLRLAAERARRLDRGEHPGTGLLLRARLEEVLAERLRSPELVSVAVLRPAGILPVGAALAEWNAACRRLADQATALGLGAIDAGFAHESDLAIVAPVAAEALRLAVLRLADATVGGIPGWSAGIAERGPGLTAADAMVSAALDAASAAASTGDRARIWSADDALLAPDVIVVEDDPALADMLRYALDSYGYSQRVFHTGPEALEALLSMRPRHGRRPLVLLDIDLPGLDGHSLHERLRLERPGVFAVVFSTGHAGEGDQLRALKAGALDYLVKPVSVRVLMVKIPLWLAHEGAAGA